MDRGRALPLTGAVTPLFDRVYSIDNLTRAWLSVRRAHGSAGIDRVTIAAFDAHWHAYLGDLARSLREETYLPLPAERVTITKRNGDERTVAILAVQDRIAQRAVHNVLEPLAERRFLSCSYAYRPGRNTAGAVDAVVRARTKGYVWAVDADIADYFPSLDHALLQRQVAAIAPDPHLLRLVALWLESGLLDPASPPTGPIPRMASRAAGVGLNLAARWAIAHLGAEPGATSDDVMRWLGDDARAEGVRRAVSGLALLALDSGERLIPRARNVLGNLNNQHTLMAGGAALGAVAVLGVVHAPWSRPSSMGALQGAVLSPLLSNLYLHPLDLLLVRRFPHVVRYADNVLIPCRTRSEAEDALGVLRLALVSLGLTLHDGKTTIHRTDEPFHFLGYAFTAEGAAPAPKPASGWIRGASDRTPLEALRPLAAATRYGAEHIRLRPSIRSIRTRR